MPSSLAPGKTGPTTDLVYTPPALARAIVGELPLRGRVLDPSRGDGAFFDALPDSVEALWCEVTQGKDFFAWHDPVDWIVTNPPWSKMREFLRHAYSIANHISYLTTVNHAFTKARIADMNAAGFGLREIIFVPTPKSPWPQSGFQLGMITWSRGHNGQTTLRPLPMIE